MYNHIRVIMNMVTKSVGKNSKKYRIISYKGD